MPRLRIHEREVSCRVVIFDKDGTLIDLRPVLRDLFYARLQVLEREVGHGLSSVFAQSCGYDPTREDLDPLGPLAVAARKEEEILCAGLLYRHGFPWPKARELAQLIFQEADKHLDVTKNLRPLPFAFEKLRELHAAGFLVALATGDGHQRTVQMLESLNWLPLFDLIVGVDEVLHPKPAPDLVWKCVEQLGVSTEDCLVVGDSCLDALMGKNAGVKYTIGVATGSQPASKLQECADLVIASLEEIEVG